MKCEHEFRSVITESKIWKTVTDYYTGVRQVCDTIQNIKCFCVKCGYIPGENEITKTGEETK